jgi:hypothetical protein
MTLIDENKKYTLNEFLRHLSHMQDKDYQTRIWIKNEGPECQAFDDAVCDFFDIGDPILDDYKSFGITEAQYKLLKKFRKEFKAFSDENDFPEEFIDTPEWERIVHLAKDVLKAFDYKKNKDD